MQTSSRAAGEMGRAGQTNGVKVIQLVDVACQMLTSFKRNGSESDGKKKVIENMENPMERWKEQSTNQKHNDRNTSIPIQHHGQVDCLSSLSPLCIYTHLDYIYMYIYIHTLN